MTNNRRMVECSATDRFDSQTFRGAGQIFRMSSLYLVIFRFKKLYGLRFAATILSLLAKSPRLAKSVRQPGSPIEPVVKNGTKEDCFILERFVLSHRTVNYVEFGYQSVREYWQEKVLADFDKFVASSTRADAMSAAISAWHIHEWIWHERNPGQNTRDADFLRFRDEAIQQCPELAWVRDVADAAKHRGLVRPSVIRRMDARKNAMGAIGGAPIGALSIGVTKTIDLLTITLSDGTALDFKSVISTVISFWKNNFFP